MLTEGALITRSRFVASILVLLLTAYSAKSVFAQSKDDIEMMEKARSKYLTGPVPSSISCGVVLDWDAFFERLKIEQTEATRERLEKLKSMKISIVTRDAEHTDVKIDSDIAPNNLNEGIRQQLQGLFQIYWSQSYGRLLTLKAGEHFDLTKTSDGYSVKTAAGSTKVVIEMNKDYAITHTNFETPQMNAVATPVYSPGEDGLLRLRKFDETVNMGSSTMVINVSLDYQRVGAYDVPKHVSMALPGSFAFDYTLTGCEVTGDSSDSTPKK